MKKQARFKKGQKVYYVIARSPYDLTVQQGKVVAVRSPLGAYHNYMYDINDYDMKESEVYGTYEEAVQEAIAYCDARIEDLKKERSKWENKLKEKGEKWEEATKITVRRWERCPKIEENENE